MYIIEKKESEKIGMKQIICERKQESRKERVRLQKQRDIDRRGQEKKKRECREMYKNESFN